MKLAAPLVAALIAAVAAVPATAAVTPIPQNQADLNGLKLFTGHKAKRHPVAAPRVPRHPFMAANGRNARPQRRLPDRHLSQLGGPLGGSMRVFSQSIDGAGGLGSCGITIAYDKRGRLITTCISATTVELRLMNPRTSTRSRATCCPRASSRPG